MRTVLVLYVFCFLALYSHSKSVYTRCEGYWTDTNSWAGNAIPVAGDSIYVKHKIILTSALYLKDNFLDIAANTFVCGFVDVDADAACGHLIINGELSCRYFDFYCWVTVNGGLYANLVIVNGLLELNGWLTAFNGPCGKVKSCNAPTSTFNASSLSICEGDCISFTDQSTNHPSGWKWYFTGAATSTANVQNPQEICYLKAGTYNVALIAKNSSGSDSVMVKSLIHVHPAPPVPRITQINDTLFCNTDTSYKSYQWYRGSALISGATNNFLIISYGGNYNVEVSNGFECKIATGINVVGIAESAISNDIFIYPNPSSGIINVILNNAVQNGELSIYNLTGEEVYTTRFAGKEQTIIHKLPIGIYFIQLIEQNKLWRKMITSNE
jgi:PKD repeat protein